jgi:hypothetical protein
MRLAFRNQLSQRQPGASLVSVTVEQIDGRWQVRGIARTPTAITPEMVADIQQDVREFVAPNIDIVVRSILEADASASGYIAAEPSD